LGFGRVFGRWPGGRRRTRLLGHGGRVQLGLQTFGELVQEFVGDVLDQAATELGRPAGDGQVGVDTDLGRVAGTGRQAGGDARGRRTVAAAVLALGLDHRMVVALVPFDEGAGARVL